MNLKKKRKWLRFEIWLNLKEFTKVKRSVKELSLILFSSETISTLNEIILNQSILIEIVSKNFLIDENNFDDWRFILNEDFPKKVCISIWGDKIDEQKLVAGNKLTIDFDVESREYNGRWYTDVKAWKVELAGTGGSSAPPPPSQPEEDLPF